ncbi:Eps-15 family protein [Megaselia abdita]
MITDRDFSRSIVISFSAYFSNRLKQTQFVDYDSRESLHNKEDKRKYHLKEFWLVFTNMALNPIQISGKHNAVYEAYYRQIDPKETGGIEAMVAAKFLKKSGLSDVVLSRIWDLSDPSGKGYLDKQGFYVSLKLVALAQSGQTINMANIFTETHNPPKVGEIPKPVPQRVVHSVPPTSQGDWSIKVIDRLKYEQLFESLKPVNNVISGNKVKGVLMESKLPMDILGKIWDLADQDRDGNLDKHEFIVAMHLVYQTLDKRIVPDVLPPELQKGRHGPPHPPPPAAKPAGDANGGFVANFPTDIAPPPAVPPLPAIVSQPQPIRPPSVGAVDWVVTPAEMQKFEIIFRDSDRDKDGLVSGLEIKNVFLQSGVPQNCLAHIWALCDTNQSGKLTMEQFALAMWFVERKKVGIEPPQALAPNMIPPSIRGVVPGIDVTPQVEPKPTYTNPELEMISKEIEELAKERRILETDIAQKEADIRIKSGEVRSLQSELDTLSATLKQLEHQKGEAQKRLDDLKNQKSEFDLALEKINEEVHFAKNQVNKIRDQCNKQEETIIEQESELNSKKSELQKLKDEETNLEKEYSSNQKELDDLTKKLQDTQLEISQVRSMVTQLLEAQRQMTDALLLCRAAVEANDAVIVSDYSLQIEPDFAEARKVLEKKQETKKVEEVAAFTPCNTAGFTTTDPFGSTTKSGFDDSFNARFDDNFGGSGFGQQDAFASDPFGDKSAVKTEGKDDFDSDPFASLHAPTGQGHVLSPGAQKGPPPRPESPSPALPPKKAKQPPPRPAPPRPLQAPQPQTDAFGTSPSGGFADFADFDNKVSNSNTFNNYW